MNPAAEHFSKTWTWSESQNKEQNLYK